MQDLSVNFVDILADHFTVDMIRSGGEFIEVVYDVYNNPDTVYARVMLLPR